MWNWFTILKLNTNEKKGNTEINAFRYRIQRTIFLDWLRDLRRVFIEWGETLFVKHPTEYPRRPTSIFERCTNAYGNGIVGAIMPLSCSLPLLCQLLTPERSSTERGRRSIHSRQTALILDEAVVQACSSDHFVAVASKTAREGSKMPRADAKVLESYSIPRPPAGLLSVFLRVYQKMCKRRTNKSQRHCWQQRMT